jgi:hypothetical protein
MPKNKMTAFNDFIVALHAFIRTSPFAANQQRYFSPVSFNA